MYSLSELGMLAALLLLITRQECHQFFTCDLYVGCKKSCEKQAFFHSLNHQMNHTWITKFPTIMYSSLNGVSMFTLNKHSLPPAFLEVDYTYSE